MKKDWSKYFSELLAGIAGGSILGMLSLLIGMNYGGNYGCFTFIDAIFGTRGYESCGAFAAIIGIIVGALIAISLVKKFNKNNKKTNIISIVTLILVPVLLGVIIFGLGDLGIILPVIIIFALLSIIPSAIITFLMNWKNILTKKRS